MPVALVAAALAACGGGSETLPTVKTNTYQGAGSSWTLSSKSDGTCTLSESDSGLKINANCSTLSSGFTKITVTSATGGNASLAPPAAGAVTYAYEIAGYMMPFIAFTEGKVVPTVASGTCASSVNHNFVVSYAKLKDANAVFKDAQGSWFTMGNYVIDGNGFSASLYDASFASTPKSIPTFTLSDCAGGLKKNIQNGEVTSLYLTQNGGAIFQQDRSKSTAVNGSEGSVENDFMLPATNDVATLAGLDGNYIGFVITSQGAGNYRTTPVSVLASNGAFAVSSRSGADLVATTANHSSFTLNANKVSASLYKGALTHTIAGGNIGCAINANIGGQKIVICSGIDPADPSNKTLYSAILKSN